MKKGHYSLINTLYSVMYAKTKIYILGKTCIFLIKLIAANFKGLKSSALKIIKKGHYGSLLLYFGLLLLSFPLKYPNMREKSLISKHF